MYGNILNGENKADLLTIIMRPIQKIVSFRLLTNASGRKLPHLFEKDVGFLMA